MVEQLGCSITQTRPQAVAVANGIMCVDKMCKISWFLEGTEFSADLLLPLGYGLRGAVASHFGRRKN